MDNETKFAGKVFFYGFGPSVVVYQNDALRLAPVVELVGWRVLDGFQTPPAEAEGTNIVNLKIGGRIEGRGGNSFYFGWGKALTTGNGTTLSCGLNTGRRSNEPRPTTPGRATYVGRLGLVSRRGHSESRAHDPARVSLPSRYVTNTTSFRFSL